VFFYYECGAKVRARPNLNETNPNTHQTNLSFHNTLTLIFIIKEKLGKQIERNLECKIKIDNNDQTKIITHKESVNLKST